MNRAIRTALALALVCLLTAPGFAQQRMPSATIPTAAQASAAFDPEVQLILAFEGVHKLAPAGPAKAEKAESVPAKAKPAK